MLLHHLGAVRVSLADLKAGDDGRTVRDSLAAVLDEPARRHEGDDGVEAPILYRLAAGCDPLQKEDEKDLWLERLMSAPGCGVLADELRMWDRMNGFRDALFREEAEALFQSSMAVLRWQFPDTQLQVLQSLESAPSWLRR